MIGRPDMRSPVPRVNAENRAWIIPTRYNTTGRVFSTVKKTVGRSISIRLIEWRLPPSQPSSRAFFRAGKSLAENMWR